MFFRDIKLVLEQYIKGESTKQEVENIVNNLSISTYIPVIRKYAIISTFSNQLSEVLLDTDKGSVSQLQGYYITYDIGLKFLILSVYCNIIISEDEKTSENYDLIIQSGFYDMIFNNSKVDIERFIEICDRVVGINNTWILNELDTIFCDTVNVQNMQQIMNILNDDKNKEMLQKVQEVQLLADPTLGKIINKAKKEIASQVMNRE